MIPKKILLIFAFLMIIIVTKAQLVNGNAYMKGTGVEIGIDSAGGFEGCSTTTSPPLPGMHFRSNNPFFGFVANPQNDGWATFDGDFFTPGSPENGWGYEVDSIRGSNNCAPVLQMPGMITNWSHIGTTYSVDWEGDASSGADLHFRINYLLGETDLFYATTVTVTNNSLTTIPDFYYYRNLDPDNNVSIGFDYTTQNTIISQHIPGCSSCVAQVLATSSVPSTQPTSYFSFLAIDTNFVAGYGGFSNRDGSDMYNGIGFTQTIGATNFADEAIYLAYRVQNLAPGDSATFKFCSVFDTSAVNCAIAALATSLSTPGTVYTNTPAFALTGGLPAGGIYSGTGVTGGNMFDPSISGAGDFTIVYTHADSSGCTASASSVIHVDVAAGVTDAVIANAISIYPNPFSTEATIVISKYIQLSGAEFHLYDILGKEVMNKTNIQSNTIKMEQKDLPAGVYFYKFINGGREIASGKLLIR
jgi:hypothetical protein